MNILIPAVSVTIHSLTAERFLELIQRLKNQTDFWGGGGKDLRESIPRNNYF